MNAVLLVQADAGKRQSLRVWIANEGVAIIEAASAEQALDVIDPRNPPAVAFCHVHLPERDGVWLAEQLRARYPQTAVVMTTERHDLALAVRSLQAGVIDYLVEPFAAPRLLEALRRGLLTSDSRRVLATLQQEVQRRQAELTEALAQLELSASRSVEAMLALQQPHDPDALDRARRIARLAVNLALTLGLGEPQLTDIERAVFLVLSHGPIGDEPHRLTILHEVPLLSAAADVAIASYERFDGSGFPHGLAGHDIPLPARIVAVAMAYDELVHSGEGVPLSPLHAVERLRTQRAAHFDPALLDALQTLEPSSAPPVLSDEAERLMEMTDVSDPRRRWKRTRLASALPVRFDGGLGTIVDVSYGGCRIEATDAIEPSPTTTFTLQIPELEFETEATWAWTRTVVAGRYWHGAALPAEPAEGGARWRAVVDALAEPRKTEWQ